MKTCSKRNLDFPEEGFPFRCKTKGKRHAHCLQCNRDASKEHYSENKRSYIVRVTKRNGKHFHETQQRLWDYLKNHPCVDCGEADPVVLEFDHIKDKFKMVSKMVHFSWAKIAAEIAKCEVRCCNCHRRKTAIQLNWYQNIV
jgi:hypothetical protein